MAGQCPKLVLRIVRVESWPRHGTVRTRDGPMDGKKKSEGKSICLIDSDFLQDDFFEDDWVMVLTSKNLLWIRNWRMLLHMH